MRGLSGRVALVTGGARGIGLATAKRLVEEGARVTITDIDAVGEDAARAVGAAFHRHDAADEAGWAAALAAAPGVTLLVNNAGANTRDAPSTPETVSLEEWRRLQRVNGESAFLGCRAALPVLRENGGGAVVNVSSLASKVAVPFDTGYAFAKAGVEQLTKTFAHVGARATPTVRFNSIHPGLVWTAMWAGFIAQQSAATGRPEAQLKAEAAARVPTGQFATPDEIAAPIVFLLSEDASHITGHALVVDGGILAG